MSIAAALSNVGGGNSMFLNRRQRARFSSERVATVTDETEEPASADEEGSFINTGTNARATARTSEEADATDIEAQAAHGDSPDSADAEEDETAESDEEDDTEGISRYAVRQTLTLPELEEERELARRRSSACVLFALFVLFRLWILALQNGDFVLLVLCLVGSSWTARWIRYNRDQEEELDRRIANYLENSGSGTNEVGRDDLRMLSFQAQLALAIMESQRQMMQGGYGHPDGEQTTPGVSEDGRSKWSKFLYKAARDKKESKRGSSYGSVAQQDVVVAKKVGFDEEPHCSICLGEYEEDEELSKLPCTHIYHEECIGAWCSNHTRCPLCNYDLESEPAEAV